MTRIPLSGFVHLLLEQRKPSLEAGNPGRVRVGPSVEPFDGGPLGMIRTLAQRRPDAGSELDARKMRLARTAKRRAGTEPRWRRLRIIASLLGSPVRVVGALARAVVANSEPIAPRNVFGALALRTPEACGAPGRF